MFCLSAAECRAAGLFTGYSASLALTSPLHARAIDNHADHNIVVNSPVDPTRAAVVPASAADRLTDRPTDRGHWLAGDVMGLNEVRSRTRMRMPIDTVLLM